MRFVMKTKYLHFTLYSEAISGTEDKTKYYNQRCPCGSYIRNQRSPGEGSGYSLQDSCLENSMERGA